MNDSNEKTRSVWAARFAGLAGHSVGVAGVAFFTVLVFVPHAAARRIAGWIMDHEGLLEASLADLVMHVALSACLWACGALIFCHVRQRMRTVRKVALRTSRGTVITETLIILPVFLLLTFGMAQLCINSIAGVLMNVAAFQSGRSYWVWQPEEGGSRAGGADAADKARIAAAAVMTPVAPGSYGTDIASGISNFGDFPESADKMRIGLTSANIPFADQLPADTAGLLADLGSLNFRLATRNNLSFWRALDSQSFAQRSLTKFTVAYDSTSVTPVTSNGRLGVKVTYLHHQVMPVVGRLFSDNNLLLGTDAPGSRHGYYASYERTYTYATQLAIPNSNMPSTGSSGTYPSEGDPSGEIDGAADNNCSGDECG